MRSDNRRPDQLRPITLITGVQKFAEGSVLVQWGETHVLCAASVEEAVPAFRLSSGGGWITGEYGMLPRSTSTRKQRRTGGRETEIQRLIGRALRAAVDLQRLGPRTVWIDCDVLQADGGTRVAAITGGYVALALAIARLLGRGTIAATSSPLNERVAAVSVGIVDGQTLLDLPYAEDSRAAVDMNVVMTSAGRFVELQGTAEQQPFDEAQLGALCRLAWGGIQQLLELQARAISLGGNGARAEVQL